MILDMPYFMTDEKWYLFEDGKYVLSEYAPEEAKKSYEEFYKAIEEVYGSPNQDK